MKKLIVRVQSSNIPAPEVPEDEIFWSDIYVHGQVEGYFNFDMCDVINMDEFPQRTIFLNVFGRGLTKSRQLDLNGKFPCHVEGYPGECTAFIWHDGSENHPTKGLIVDNTDSSSIQWAESKLVEKPIII